MSTKGRVLVAVTNDISSDQRVHKVANYLTRKGFEVVVFGRVLPTTFEVDRLYKIVRRKLWFNANFLFYAEYNIRLLIFLLKNKSTYILSNDLDTLPACFIASRLKTNKLVYDSHELFTEVPELQGRKFIRSFWKMLEKLFVPKVKNAYTVSNNIAAFYKNEYGIEMGVIRNVPYLINAGTSIPITFPTKNKILLYQGTLSENRGLKQVMLSLNYLEKVDLVIIGYGKEKDELVNFATEQKLNERVFFLGRIDYDILHNYTKKADIGILLEELVGLSFKYALPNKLFDYIHNELPVLASPLIEVKELIDRHGVGILISSHEPKHIAEKISVLLSNEDYIKRIKNNQRVIKENYCWENERQKLDTYFS